MIESYTSRFTEDLEKTLEKLKREDSLLFERTRWKMLEILSSPEHYKPLRNVLAGKRRVHIGSFVLTYVIEEMEVLFLSFKHHKDAYDE